MSEKREEPELIEEWGMVLDPPIELQVGEIPAFLKGLAQANKLPKSEAE